MTNRRNSRGAGDPGRPNRLVDAALEVMLEAGIHKLTHRAVAAKAGVPLGSTTYYFKDIDSLLSAAIERLIGDARGHFDRLSDIVSSQGDLPLHLSKMLFDRLTRERDIAALAYQLYGLAMCRPEFRDLSRTWMQVTTDTLGRHVDESTAQVLMAMIDGLMLQGLVTSEPPSEEKILTALRLVTRPENDFRDPG